MESGPEGYLFGGWGEKGGVFFRGGIGAEVMRREVPELLPPSPCNNNLIVLFFVEVLSL